MIWQKISPYQHKNRYIQSFEYMFIFSKGFRKTANLICDRKNKWAGTQIHGTERQANGKTKSLSEVQKSKKVKEFGARFNIWDIPPEKSNKTGHPAPFSEQLAKDHILTWSNEGDTILDCFMGSGTTAVACANTNRKYIGFEISKEYCEIANNRIDNLVKEMVGADNGDRD
jgi:site-specific DNA-methyltransferase (adenine-specific)